MLLDIILAVVLLVSVVMAARIGFTRELIRIASLVIGLLVAMWGYGFLAQKLQPLIEDERAAVVAAFAGIYFGCLITGDVLSYILRGVLELTGLRVIDVALGGVFGVVRGLLLAVVLVLMLLSFRPVPGSTTLVAESRIAPVLVNLARTIALLAPKGMRDAFGKGADQVREERAASGA